MVRDMLPGPRARALPVAIYRLLFGSHWAVVAMAFRMDSRVVVLLVIADGMVLGCWSATGAIKAKRGIRDHARDPAGIMTAVGGGMIRDISAEPRAASLRR